MLGLATYHRIANKSVIVRRDRLAFTDTFEQSKDMHKEVVGEGGGGRNAAMVVIVVMVQVAIAHGNHRLTLLRTSTTSIYLTCCNVIPQ